mmetsp:Transcript_7658/g.20232  ORF Transcript_7658/g.20232 Transcript_7658/m.20232 type:complete len:573 (-) Transcript_7658:1090-2808(-)
MHRKNVGSHGFRRASRGTARHRSHSVVGEALWSKMGGATVSGGTAERTCSAPNQTHSIASFAAHRSNNQYVSHATRFASRASSASRLTRSLSNLSWNSTVSRCSRPAASSRSRTTRSSSGAPSSRAAPPNTKTRSPIAAMAQPARAMGGAAGASLNACLVSARAAACEEAASAAATTWRSPSGASPRHRARSRAARALTAAARARARASTTAGSTEAAVPRGAGEVHANSRRSSTCGSSAVSPAGGGPPPAPDVVRQANGHAPELDRLGDREPELLAELRVGPAPARLRPAGRAARLRDDVALEQGIRPEEVPLRGRQVLRLPAVHDEERQARGRQRRPAQGDAPPLLLLLPLQLPLVLRVEVVGPLLVAGPEHGHGALEEALVAVVRAVRRVDEPDPLAVELVVRERVDLPQVEARAPDRRVPADGVVVQDGDVDGGRLDGRRRQVRQGEVQHVVEDARRHLFHDARLALAAVDAHARVGVAQPVQVLRLEVPALDDVDLHGVVAGLHGRGAAALELVDDAPGHHGARAPPLVQLLLLPRREVPRREGVLLEQPVLLRPLVPVLRALRTSP